MSGKMKLLIIAIVLILAGGLAVAFGDTKGEEPALECVEEGTPSSGFVDDDQGGCPISIDSWDEYADWLSQPQPIKIAGVFAGLAGVGLAIGVGITAIVQKSRARTVQR